MRFSTNVGVDQTPQASVRRWHISEPSSPSSQPSIPVWEKEQSERKHKKKPEAFERTTVPNTSSMSLTSISTQALRQSPEVKIPCPDPIHGLSNKNRRDNRVLRGMHRKSLSQRLVGLLMALCIAVGLLGCIMDRLSGELDKIERELEKRNEIIIAKEQLGASLSSHPAELPSERRARRLAAAGVEAEEGWSSARHREGLWNGMTQHFSTVLRILEFLSKREQFETTAAVVRTVYKLSETILPPAIGSAGIISNGSPPATEAPTSFSASNSVQHRQELFHKSHEATTISLKPQIHSGDPVRTLPVGTGALHIPKSAWTGSIFSKTVSGNPTSYNLFSSKTNITTPLQSRSVIPAFDGGEKVTHVDSVQKTLTDPREQVFPIPNGGMNQPWVGGNSERESHATSNPSESFEGIVLWELPRGRSLCRIFGVAKLADGTLFLPSWMQKHKGALSASCGLKKAMYVFENQSKGQFKRDYSSDNTLVDLSFANQDLFSLHTPRHHMPHFLSDIISPLVATEVILGSGRHVVPFKFVSPEGASTIDVSPNVVYEVKPILFLDNETVSKSPTNWVPSLARFFAHPSIGCNLVPDTASDHRFELEGVRRLLYFRSILLSNINPYEPYGLFGADGKNHVFSLNGISREPTWTSEGMLKRPCKVSVTVLTRKGHRALLELDELQKVIKARFIEQGLDLDFKVVDFTGLCFEDQVRIMQDTNVLIASHGAGNTNLVFLKPGGTVIEVFPFSYKAGPFDGFAKIFGLEYKTAMSAPQTSVFKGCMRRREKNVAIMKEVFDKWDKAVEEDKITPWIHRLDFEKEFGEPGKSEGMTTRICARQQQLKFDLHAVAQMTLDSGLGQCHFAQMMLSRDRNES